MSGETVSHIVLADSMPAGLGEQEEGRGTSPGEGR